jgi:hypothetical protein
VTADLGVAQTFRVIQLPNESAKAKCSWQVLPGTLEINQQTTNNNRVGVNRFGQTGRRGASVFVGQNGHDMNSKCKSTALHMRM